MGEACCGSRPGAGSKVQRAGPDQEASCITRAVIITLCLSAQTRLSHPPLQADEERPKGSASLSAQISSHLKSSFFLGVC